MRLADAVDGPADHDVFPAKLLDGGFDEVQVQIESPVEPSDQHCAGPLCQAPFRIVQDDVALGGGVDQMAFAGPQRYRDWEVGGFDAVTNDAGRGRDATCCVATGNLYARGSTARGTCDIPRCAADDLKIKRLVHSFVAKIRLSGGRKRRSRQQGRLRR